MTGRAVIFDLDGTLIDSAPAITVIANRMLADLSLAPLTVAEARGYIGNGIGAFVHQALEARDSGDAERALTRFRLHYDADDGSGNRPYPGVEAALDALCDAGFALGICTNKPDVPTRIVLETLGWTARFGAVVGGDTLAVRKPDPAPLLHCAGLLGVAIGACLYTGDSEVDARTAHAVPVPFLLHTEGYRKAPVEALRPAASFDHFEALPSLVAALSPGG